MHFKICRKASSSDDCERVTGNPEVARGMIVNHKRIARIMREDNLLVVRLDRSRPRGHALRAARVYLNLAARMKLLGPNQLWVADITYIRLACEFVYLAVVIDVFSRKVIGWALGRSLQTQLPICALERAIASRKPPQESCTTRIRACNMHAASTCKSSGSMGCCPV
jgi:transposase InsO family protein